MKPKFISTALSLMILCGCTTRIVRSEMAAYRECVSSQAMEMINANASADEIARLAAAQCQGNLALITDKLREKNAWIDYYGSNADGYAESLRERTIAEVAEEIADKRGR